MRSPILSRLRLLHLMQYFLVNNAVAKRGDGAHCLTTSSVYFQSQRLSVSLACGEMLLRAEAATQGNCFDAKSGLAL
jgi:hypothetical protein